MLMSLFLSVAIAGQFPDAKPKIVSGKVSSVEKSGLKINDDGTKVGAYTEPSTKIMVDGKRGTLKQVSVGDTVTALVDPDTARALRITVTTAKGAKEKEDQAKAKADAEFEAEMARRNAIEKKDLAEYDRKKAEDAAKYAIQTTRDKFRDATIHATPSFLARKKPGEKFTLDYMVAGVVADHLGEPDFFSIHFVSVSSADWQFLNEKPVLYVACKGLDPLRYEAAQYKSEVKSAPRFHLLETFSFQIPDKDFKSIFSSETVSMEAGGYEIPVPPSEIKSALSVYFACEKTKAERKK